jgi:hypothetical protein
MVKEKDSNKNGRCRRIFLNFADVHGFQKPISALVTYSFLKLFWDLHKMHFVLSVKQDDLFGTLECVLMTARRGNLKLLSLQVSNAVSEAVVSIRVSADDADWLALYLLRLQNIVGVFNVEMTQEKPCVQSSEESIAAFAATPG